MFSKASDEWSTPQDLFDALDLEFGFDVDVAATDGNSKCDGRYWGPDNPGNPDALAIDYWGFTDESGRPQRGFVCFLNPPYSKCAAFVAKAAEQRDAGVTTVMLIPSRTDTRYWHAHIWDRHRHQPRRGVEVRFLKGRLKFGGGKNSAPFPSVIVIFRGERSSDSR
jgi:phage N-6-adenine-methyltransferase